MTHRLELLFVEFGSKVSAETVALLQTWVTAERHGTVMTTKSALWAGRVAHVQVTFDPDTEHLPSQAVIHAGGGPENNVEFATSEMFLLSLGPLFKTFSVNMAVPFPGQSIVIAVCDSARSANVWTVPQVCDELLPLTLSSVADEMLAVLQS